MIWHPLFWDGVITGIAATIAVASLVGWIVLAFFDRLDRQVDEPQ